MKPTVILRLFTALGLALFYSAMSAANDEEQSDSSNVFSNYDSTKKVTDLMFMTNKGQGVSIATYSVVDNSVKITEDSSGLLYADSKDKSGSVQVKSVYGVAENFYIALQLGYLVGNNSKVEYGPASTSNGQKNDLKSQGFQDIDLEFKWRLLEQDTSKVNVDVGISYSPKFSNGKNAEVGKKGDAIRGGDLTHLNVQIGNKFSKLAYVFEVDYGIYGKQTTRDSAGTYEKTGGNELSLKLAFQYRPTDLATVSLGVGRGSVESSKVEDNTGSSTDEKSADGYGLLASGYYEITDKEWIGLDYSRVTVSTHKVDSGGTILKAGEQVVNQIALKFISSF